MRIPAIVKPFYVTLPVQHRRVLDLLKTRTGKSLKGLMLEAIEQMAVKHGLVQEGTQIHNWPDWD